MTRYRFCVYLNENIIYRYYFEKFFVVVYFVQQGVVGADEDLSKIKSKEAVTLFRVRSYNGRSTLVECRPVTGRTHQIRLHLAFLGCPVVGDTVYGKRHPSIPISRHFLHAAGLEIRLPEQEKTNTFEAPLPPDMLTVLEDLRE